MSGSARKLIGTLVLLPAICAYLAAAATLADFVPDFWLAKLVYFVIAGVVWAFPAKRLFEWMNSAPAPPADET